MKNLIRIFSVVLAGGALFSCIENDLPYPVRELRILGATGQGFTCGAEDINNKDRTVTLNLGETTDPANVAISALEVTSESKMSVEFPGVFDIRAGLGVTLWQYPDRDYKWSIRSKQVIERYFTVESQIGSAVIDAENFTALVYVPEETDLENIRIKSLKLGPKEISTMKPAMEEITSFETYRTVEVSYRDVKEVWQLYVEPTDIKVLVSQADAWTRVMWVYGQSMAGTEQGFRWRKQGDEVWTTVPAAKIESSGGNFKTCIAGLEPETAYEIMAYSDSDVSTVETRTTGAETPLTNGGFEQWKEENGIYYPGPSKADAYWGTGNTGAKIGNEVLSYIAEIKDGEGNVTGYDKRPGSPGKWAARLETKKVGIAGIGRLAAGNLFTGQYVTTLLTDGVVGFGRPFTQRPTGLRGWIKYNCGPVTDIDGTPAGVTLAKGDPDVGVVYMALGTWTPEEYGTFNDNKGVRTQFGTNEVPIAVYTKNKDTMFNSKSPAVVAYGEMTLRESNPEWKQFTIKLDYVATNIIPTHVVVVCCSSRYGDYFTGSTESVMVIDDFEFIYDEIN